MQNLGGLCRAVRQNGALEGARGGREKKGDVRSSIRWKKGHTGKGKEGYGQNTDLFSHRTHSKKNEEGTEKFLVQGEELLISPKRKKEKEGGTTITKRTFRQNTFVLTVGRKGQRPER